MKRFKMKYCNDLIVNGVRYTHTIEAANLKEAYKINSDRKRKLTRGKQIKGRLQRCD